MSHLICNNCWFNHKPYQKRTWSLCRQWWWSERIARLFVVIVIVHMYRPACAFLTFHQLFHLHLKSNKSAVNKSFPLGFSEQWYWLQSQKCFVEDCIFPRPGFVISCDLIYAMRHSVVVVVHVMPSTMLDVPVYF